MQTTLVEHLMGTEAGREADGILRACVHCGFCAATCPTYQLLGDELDGPRGRIYQIKVVLEGEKPDRNVQRHLDRCLVCLNCETTCPSGVQYHRLLDIGKRYMAKTVPRPWHERLLRWLLRSVLPYHRRLSPLLGIGRVFKFILPQAVKQKIPPAQHPSRRPGIRHERRVLLFEGCVQATMTPSTNHAVARCLDRVGISVIPVPDAGCCGALSHHLGATAEALDFMRHNIDIWWSIVQQGVEAIVVCASGCGAVILEYAYFLRDDAQYREKARRIAALCKDVSQVLSLEDMTLFKCSTNEAIAFHSPCSLQHGQKIHGVVEGLLRAAGYNLVPVEHGHSCCGSAGAYSILQPRLSGALLREKLSDLQAAKPSRIATANVGCQLHLQSQAMVPVVHWMELLAESTVEQGSHPVHD